MEKIYYIDYDEVILNTQETMFKIWNKIPFNNKIPEFIKRIYIKRTNWYKLLNKSRFINNSNNILKQLNPKKFKILTKVNDIKNEGIAKINFLKDHDIKLDVILVPYELEKGFVINPKNSVLIDDTVKNLDYWKSLGGQVIFFNKDNKNSDLSNTKNNYYKKINSLEFLLKIK